MKFQIGDLFVYTTVDSVQYGIVIGFGQKNIYNRDDLKVSWIHSRGSRWKGEHDCYYLERTLSNPDFGWKHYPAAGTG